MGHQGGPDGLCCSGHVLAGSCLHAAVVPNICDALQTPLFGVNHPEVPFALTARVDLLAAGVTVHATVQFESGRSNVYEASPWS